MNTKRIMTALLLASAVPLTGCGDKTTNIKETESEYITEDVKITDSNEALQRLKDGNNRFLNNDSALINVTSERREELTDGQEPYAVVISCSDSRVTPSIIFNSGLGEIFDIRLAGNVVDKDALGSIEYGVHHLHAPLIVVMGHEKCGAVTAAYEKLKNGTEVEGNINSLVDKISPNIANSDSLDKAIHDNIDGIKNQIEADPIIKELVDSGKVKIVEAYYSLDGKVTFD